MARHTPTYPAAFWKLTGPLAGQTFQASAAFLFVDGVFSSRRFSPADLPRMDRHFEQWQAIRFDPAKEGRLDGERNVSSEGEREADGGVLPEGGKSAAGAEDVHSIGGNEASTVDDGGRLVPSGNGQAEGVGGAVAAAVVAPVVDAAPTVAPDPFRARLIKAVLSLDPKVDEHWTSAGKPALPAVETALGHAGVKRADVEAACPGYVRPSRVSPPDGSVQEA